MEDSDQFDGLYMTILQKGQGIQNFFDSLFSFMSRKTDYFADESKKKSKIILNFRKFMELC
jgi:hypothetical protein